MGAARKTSNYSVSGKKRTVIRRLPPGGALKERGRHAGKEQGRGCGDQGCEEEDQGRAGEQLDFAITWRDGQASWFEKGGLEIEAQPREGVVGAEEELLLLAAGDRVLARFAHPRAALALDGARASEDETGLGIGDIAAG